MSRRLRDAALVLPITIWFCGCTTVALYQSPIGKFQTAVNSANDSIRPYLTGVNGLVVRANLYDKIGQDKNWGTEDLKEGIPEREIQARLQALSLIASYANALGAVANSKDVEDLGQAAQSLGASANGLGTTIQGLTKKREVDPAQGDVGKQAATLDLSGPVSSVVTLVGTVVIEQKQREAVEAAVLQADKPVSELIGLLKSDLRDLALVDATSYAAMRAGMVKIYNDARRKSDPKGLISLIDQFVQEDERIQTLRAVQVESLLSDMQTTQTALVTFAKSSKKPEDLSSLAAQVDVFTAHAKLFEDAIASIR